MTIKFVYKGQKTSEDFLVFAESQELVDKYRKDKTTPLVDVVQQFKVYVTHGRGNQGVYDEASKAMLENEFGTKNADEALKYIIENGEYNGVQDSIKRDDEFTMRR